MSDKPFELSTEELEALEAAAIDASTNDRDPDFWENPRHLTVLNCAIDKITKELSQRDKQIEKTVKAVRDMNNA